MKTYGPRCTTCATSLDSGANPLATALKSLLHHGYYCAACKITIPKASAEAMGQSYGMHLHHLKAEVIHATEQLKRLEINDALRALEQGLSLEQIHRAHTIDNVVRFAREVYRPLLLDQAHGRHATLDVGMKKDESGKVIAAGVWGCSSAELGERQWDLLFARVGVEQYVCYQPKRPTQWLHEAIRQKNSKPVSPSDVPSQFYKPPTLESV